MRVNLLEVGQGMRKAAAVPLSHVPLGASSLGPLQSK